MMKGKIAILLSCLFINCSPVNTTDGQTSDSIRDSKANKFFIAEYRADKSSVQPGTMLPIEEIWVEEGWFNDIENGEVVKTLGNFCQLCFKMKQSKDMKFSVRYFGTWRMEESQSERYVGFSGDIYTVSLNDCNPDSITLRLSLKADGSWHNAGMVKLFKSQN